MDTKKYWKEKHQKYSQQEWINNHTIFAKFAIKYFPKTGKLLELGAGQGQDSRFFAKNNYQVLSTDFSREALDISKKKTADEKLRVDYKVVDLAKKLPFSKNSFDIVYSHLAVHYFDNIRTIELFNEIANILKPGGVLALLLNTSDDPEVQNSKLSENGLYETPSGLVKRFYSTSDINKLTSDKFETIILDNNGETYKDEIKTLIRYIGKKKEV